MKHCKDCPHVDSFDAPDGDHDMCDLNKEEIIDGGVPDWCPLFDIDLEKANKQMKHCKDCKHYKRHRKNKFGKCIQLLDLIVCYGCLYTAREDEGFEVLEGFGCILFEEKE